MNKRNSGEGVDGRTKPSKETCPALGVEQDMQTSLRVIANQAKEDKGRRFTNLSKILTKENLKENFKILNKKAAAGIDGVSYQEYAKELDKNITGLLERVRNGKYRARFV